MTKLFEARALSRGDKFIAYSQSKGANGWMKGEVESISETPQEGNEKIIVEVQRWNPPSNKFLKKKEIINLGGGTLVTRP